MDWEVNKRLLYIDYAYKIVKHCIQKVLEKEERRRQLYSQNNIHEEKRKDASRASLGLARPHIL